MDCRVTDRTPHKDYRFRAPQELQLPGAEPLNILIVGSCLSAGVGHQLSQLGHRVDQSLLNLVGGNPEISAEKASTFDFQFVQIPLRVVYSEFSYFTLHFNQPVGHQNFFALACEYLARILDDVLLHNRQHGILTFVANFITPQQNPMGRLAPRYDLRNPVYFIERLNQYLYELLNSYNDVHLIDVDQISATFGRMYHQDDHVFALNHGGVLTEWDHYMDQGRIEPTALMSDMFTMREFDYLRSIGVELQALYRTCRHVDQVKMVVVDLDDTLWRGVVAEDGLGEMEGWPLGMAEALVFLKERGVLLAVISKNDEARIETVWDDYFKGLLSLDAFAIRKLNWRPKAENMAEVLAQANLLPRSVVFVDDNPAERAAMSDAYPDMRVLGADLYYLRRILLWAPETQTAAITAEAGERIKTIQANIARTADRNMLSREEFLAGLALKITPSKIVALDSPAFARALELLNRTNQFNTTGQRWTAAELTRLFQAGGALYAFEVEDRHARYGLTGVGVVAGTTIKQFVMSCRVIGLDAELAMLAHVCKTMKSAGAKAVTAVTIDTDVNLLSRDLYARAGFQREGERWRKSLGGDIAPPAHAFLTGDAVDSARQSGSKLEKLYKRLRRPDATVAERINHFKTRTGLNPPR